jgi:hypothetical protein
MTAPFPPLALDQIAPAETCEGPEASGGLRHGGSEDRVAFHDVLGHAMAPPEDGTAAAGAARGDTDRSAAHAGLASTLLHLGGPRGKRGSSPLDEARSELDQARRSRAHERGARADAEGARETADETVSEALAAAFQNARHASSVHLAGASKRDPSTAPGAARGKAEGNGAPAVDAAARATLHEHGAAARASAVKSALDAAAPLGLTTAGAREHPEVHSPGRRAAEREGPGEKDRAAVKRETGAATSRPEAPNLTAPDARAPALRPSPDTSFAGTRSSAPDEPRAALPPSPGPDVQGALLQHAAHLKIEAGAMGALELHMRVREGALHLRVEGDAAHTVEARAGELSRALAGEGLKLAPIESAPRHAMSHGAGTQQGAGGGRSFEERREAWDQAAESEPAQRAPSPRSSQVRPASHRSGNVHVKA